MNGRRIVRHGSWLALFLGCATGDSSEPGEDRVLVFSRTEGFRHASIGAATEALARLADGDGFELVVTERGEAFTPTNLERYAAVVFLSTTGDVLDDSQQAAFMQFIRAGGGYVGIHSASDTEYGRPWYGELVGAYFSGHPTDPNVRTGRLRVADPDHAATASLPGTWIRADEWYDLRDRQAGLSILLEIDETSYKTPEEMPQAEPRPIAWYREFEGGRTFYTALGHTAESYSEPQFLAHVGGGLRWVLGGRGGESTSPGIAP